MGKFGLSFWMQDDDLVGWILVLWVFRVDCICTRGEWGGGVGEPRARGGMMKFGCVAYVGRETCEILGFQTVM